MLKLICLCLGLQLAVALGENVREPKFLFVTSETSMKVATTTSMLSSTATCYLVSKTTYKTCTGRRKKRAVIDDSLDTQHDLSKLSVTKVNRKIADISSGKADEDKSERKAKFAWHYMTTTMTSTSYSTSTSTTFTTTMSILLQSCTPSNAFTLCG